MFYSARNCSKAMCTGLGMAGWVVLMFCALVWFVPPAVASSGASAPTLHLVQASRGTVREIQRLLTELGYQPGPVDGKMGGRTRLAIRQFQRQQKMTVTGQPSDEVLARLQLARKPKGRSSPPAPPKSTLAGGSSSGAGLLRDLTGLLTPGSSSGGQQSNQTVTLGIRGLQREDLASARPNSAGVRQLEQQGVSPSAARSMAANSGLRARKVAYPGGGIFGSGASGGAGGSSNEQGQHND